MTPPRVRLGTTEGPVETARSSAPRLGLSGSRAASIEAVVRLGSDTAAVGLAITLTRPATGLAALCWGLTVLVSFALVGLYGHRLCLSALNDVPAIVVGSTIGPAAIFVALGIDLPHAALGAGLGATLAVTSRACVYALLRSWRSRGVLIRDTVLVGTGSRAGELVTRILEHPETGLRLRGVLGVRSSERDGLPLVGDLRDLATLTGSGAVDTLIVGDASSEEEQQLVDALRACSTSTEIFVLPRLSELAIGAQDEVWGVPLQRVRRGRSLMRMRVKRASDVTLAAVGLVAVSWVIGLAALALRLELGPGVLYRQERVGLDGRRFQLLKLRSMSPLPPGCFPEWAASAERTGPVGAFVRRYSIDELPQLVNVLRGEMSLVGPRPERPEFVEKFGDEIPSYVHRHRVMVGLTGLASVEGLRGDTSISDRAYFDNWYIEHWSLWLDLKIMVRTARVLLRATGR